MEYFGDEFSDSAWYYNHQLYRVGEPLPTTDDAIETHGYWISEHGKEFGLDIPELEWNDDGSEKWQEAMRIAFDAGFIRIQKFNDITTISIADFSKKYIDKVFELINDYPDYLSGKNIEVMTLEYECAQFEENYDCPRDGNYICADNLNDLMIKLDSITSSLIKSSYRDFDWQGIKNYCENLKNKDFSKMDDDSIYDYICDYFEKYNVDFELAQDNWIWVTEYICEGHFSGNTITLSVNWQKLINGLRNDKNKVVSNLSQVITHELMHKYQNSKHLRKHSKEYYSERLAYYLDKDEISAHIISGVIELLDNGYTKEQMLDSLSTLDSDIDKGKGIFWNNTSLFDYWEIFGNYNIDLRYWKQFKKELYDVISNIEE